ncbi:WXG100 family type VII secretion target [Amycolatopsis echigonensis]|uniref:ESAT-6-like protein n=1 Tax=Amycolatopsis echigonensis TaxID=2576905 RepID=A0A8E1VXD1_9PSEU|nr:WXG100 family type VII secretion target [Amycolatopsis echigonensis]MBB2500123.1 WXG100 family type VII secretion target [Amycolatopsis echigonensis]
MDPVPAPAGLPEQAERFAAAIDAANACLGTVNSEMAALQASWRGEAAVRFGQAMNDWEQQFDRILGSLADLVDVARGAAAPVAANCSDERVRGADRP